MRRTTLLSLGLLALTARAYAFAPVDTGAHGIEGQRVLRFDAIDQARLAHSPAWKRFLATEGQGWQARFDERIGTPHRMWGAPIDIGPTADDKQVVAGLMAFVDRHPELLGADSSRLRLHSANYVEENDTWYVDLDVFTGGAPIDGGGITARIVHGRLVMLGADTYPGLDAPETALIPLAQGQRIALDKGPAAGAVHRDVVTERVVVPVEIDNHVTLRTAWRTKSNTDAPVGKWTTWVDDQTGAVFGSHDDVRYFSGAVEGVHDVRTVDGQLETSPLPWVQVTDGTITANADHSGVFALDGTEYHATLQSPYFRVLNNAGPEADLGFSDLDGDGLFDDASSTPAERSTYVFLHRTREWGEKVAPGRVSERMDGNVNLNETCNAYFDGAVNFFSAGDGCNNTGRIEDVVFHEWGHGFHYYSLRAGTFDGSLSEGAADTVAFFQTGDHVIAPYFMVNGHGIRDVAPNMVYPDDYQASELYVHENGLIFAGSMWDLLQGLKARLGDEAGQARTEAIFAELLRGGPDVESSYDEALLGDDDNGDLSDGTPDQCDLVEAFGQHGLGPLGSGAPVLAYHEPADHEPSGTTVSIHADLVQTAPQCYSFDPVDAAVMYRVNGGDWTRRGLLIGADLNGTIPAQEPGSYVEYYIEVTDADGHSVMSPERGPVAPYTYYAGDVLVVHCDDFEASDGGWTHELIAGRATEGADDWQWGTPRGQGGDPDAAFSGDNVWGNDLGGGNWNGLYQDGKTNRLTSPVLSTGHYDGVFLEYRRWLQVEDGIYDDARILANDEVVWTNVGNVDTGADATQDAQWMPHVVDLGGRGDHGDVSIAFEIQSDEGNNFGGWTIDDVCLMAPNTPDNRLGIDDFVAQGDGNSSVDLTWTNPVHAPLEEVRVVRRAGGMPTGPRSGQVVFDDQSPELGAAMTAHDDNAGDRAWYYAVYANDGDQWLSWTVDGWNADLASVSGDPEEQVAKGCSTVPVDPATFGVGLSLLGLFGLRRRK